MRGTFMKLHFFRLILLLFDLLLTNWFCLGWPGQPIHRASGDTKSLPDWFELRPANKKVFLSVQCIFCFLRQPFLAGKEGYLIFCHTPSTQPADTLQSYYSIWANTPAFSVDIKLTPPLSMAFGWNHQGHKCSWRRFVTLCPASFSQGDTEEKLFLFSVSLRLRGNFLSRQRATKKRFSFPSCSLCPSWFHL